MKKEINTTKETNVQNEKSTKVKMYILCPSDASSKDAKKFRGKRRRILFNYANDIISLSLSKDKENDLKNAISNFCKMYKSQYTLNDFSLSSLYVGTNETKCNDLKRMLQIVQKSFAKKSNPKKKK